MYGGDIMIIYQNQKPIGCTETDCVGVVGDNIAYTQDFYIKGVSDESISYTLHLRFADGSVNSIAVKNVLLDNNGTMLRWVVKKEDIFTHGYFELQIEGRNHLGLVYQTEIVQLFAHESLPVEDREYENPNSETLRLREEAYAALEEMKIQQANIEANAKIIEQSGLSNKADKATTIAGYGITDAYTKSEVDSKVDGVEKSANKVSEKTSITDESIDYPSIEYLENYYYDFSETDNLLGEKADKTTTLAGYGITDAYTKNEVDSKVDSVEKSANKIGSSTDITDESINYPSIEYLKNYYYDFSETDNLLGEKYDESNVEYGIGTPTVAQYFPDSVKSADFVYQRIGKFVTVNINAEFNQYSGNQVGFYGFPYANQIANGSKGVCISSLYSQNNNIKWLNDKSWLLITTDNSNGFSDGEKINFTFTYPIS